MSSSLLDQTSTAPQTAATREIGTNALESNTDDTSGRGEIELAIATCTWQQAALNTFFYMFGAMQVPFAYSQMGWFWGTLVMVSLSILSTHSGWVLIDICVRKRVYCWKDVAALAYGSCGMYAIEILQVFSLFLMGIVFTLSGAGSWQQAFPKAPLCQWQWVLINAAPYLVFLQIPSFSGSRAMRMATLLTLIMTVWRVCLYMTLFLLYGTYPYRCYDGQTATTVLSAAANLMGSFGVKVLIPEMVREMKRPADMSFAWTASQAVVVPLYWLVGIWGFALFGVFNQGTGLFNNFKHVAASEVFFIFGSIVGYLPGCYGQILLFLKVELYFGVLPTDWWRVSNIGTNRFPRVPPVLFRLCFRTMVLCTWVFFALMLIGMGIFNLVSLVSAISNSGFSFFLPYLFYWRVFRHDMSGMRKMMYGSFFMLGLAFGLLGVYYSVKHMLNMQTAGIFAFSDTCRGTAFFLGKYDAPGYSGTDGGYSHATGAESFHDTFYEYTCGVNGSITCSQYGGCCVWDQQQERVACAAQ